MQLATCLTRRVLAETVRGLVRAVACAMSDPSRFPAHQLPDLVGNICNSNNNIVNSNSNNNVIDICTNLSPFSLFSQSFSPFPGNEAAWQVGVGRKEKGEV